VTAFGPFAGTERVDFDALSAAGLFLFTGPTGAGKTSVLDGVCFALFGQVPGARAQARSLRSDHAATTVRPEVVLEATMRGRRIRITRSPAWDRPKRRGDGVTTEPAKILLEERGAQGWCPLSTRLDEAGQLIGRLLGLTLSQFCQVVLLPQGQFAEFLRADAERRRDLLESLFDTSRFADVERWLVARRQDASRSLDEIDQRLGRVLAQVAEVAGEQPPADDGPDRPASAAQWAAGALERARRSHESVEGRTVVAERRHGAAADALQAAALVDDAHRRRRALEQRLDELLETEGRHKDMAAEVAAARLVAPLVPLVEDAARLQVRLEEARAGAESTFAELGVDLALTGTDGAGSGAATVRPTSSAGGGAPRPVSPRLRVARLPSREDLGALARARRAEIGGLAEMVHGETEADRLTDRIAEAERTTVELDDQAGRLGARLAAAPQQRDELEAAAAASRAAVEALPGSRRAAAEAAARADAGALRDRLARDRLVLTDEVRARTDREQAARSRWLDLRQARLDGMAAELATDLTAGVACPVCGSGHHPAPAQPAPGAVTRELETAAAEQVVRLAEAVAEANRELATNGAALAAARAAAGGDSPVADLFAGADAAAELLDGVAALAARATDDAHALATFGEDHEGWVRQRVSLDERARGLRQRIADDGARLEDLRRRLDAARGDDPTVTERARRLERLADALDWLATQTDTVAKLEEQAAEALERAELAVRARGLGGAEDVLPAARDEQTVTGLEDAVRGYQAELRSVCRQLDEPALADLAGRPAPDMAGLRDRLREAEAARDGLAGERGRATHRVASLTRLVAALDTELADRAPAAAAHRLVDGLSRLAEGKSADNRLRMSLSGYVLAARLEQVAAAASERLARMTSGRYQLVHRAETSGGRGRGGLVLRVVDGWTGAERDPASLSGGETFAASLALALGLADVVTAEAGGTLLETLFVDEGFGSLDEDTLDEVMGVLDGLRDGGRCVGLVSHVAELRQRIPVRLEVDKGRTGSHLRQ
ncbi:MAG: repair protein SbcC/Rad50, partial [Actinomycetota bacterium]|nr:repair protein SbcC/Rad50 [Actinomycetota bacterium]